MFLLKLRLSLRTIEHRGFFKSFVFRLRFNFEKLLI